MKKFFKTIGKYFVNLFNAIFNVKSEPKQDDKYSGVSPDRDKLDKFNLEAIKELMDKIPALEQQDNDYVQEQFIANRKAINEYKEWYSKLVGYNKPPEILKKIIEADLKMDRIEMDRLFYQLYQQDLEQYKQFNRTSNIVRGSKSNIPNEIRELMAKTQITKLKDRPSDLKRILSEAREHMKKLND